MTDRTDLADLATRAKTLAEALSEFSEVLVDAYNAALGEEDPETHEETVPGNGDDPKYFETAKEKVSRARLEMNGIIDLLATQQGYRDFEDQGVEV